MAQETILIVDDEFRLRKLVGDFLRKAGYAVLEAEDGEKALALLSGHVALVILDVMMPGKDGWSVCREIRARYSMPVIILTARSQEMDELFGFELGADEYITKPFSPQILVARVKALLRRTEVAGTLPFQFGDLTINTAAHEVHLEGQSLNLTPKEYDLLLYLAMNRGKALSREQILERVWDYRYFGDLRTVDTHVNRLRIKLGPLNKWIQTVRGLGYLFEEAK
ncbi:response regulator transcription factor [Acetonema longum]|uniref:Two component transcriptional regulator n=1 Tax=Acetonema longum DSM 6540 TaxID=1009370 RepID=F7NMN7_9FIRM|nr:response regulator transcription factor [Acetonema longum]EGO62701.1 two component transcriptional regulator [Acetonema longum DSM 6540]